MSLSGGRRTVCALLTLLVLAFHGALASAPDSGPLEILEPGGAPADLLRPGGNGRDAESVPRCAAGTGAAAPEPRVSSGTCGAAPASSEQSAAAAEASSAAARTPGREDEPLPREAEGWEREAPRAVPSSGARIYLLDRLAAGASLGYFTAREARILSEIQFDFPFLVIRQKSVYVRGSLETSTVRTGTRLRADAFQAQNIEYLVEGGARDYLSNRLAIAAFYGRQGQNLLDKSGALSIDYLGVGFESVGFPRPGGGDRLEWRLAAGAVLDQEGVEGDAFVRAAIIYDLWRGARSSLGIDGSLQTLLDGLSGQTEYRVGPRWTFPLPNGIRANVFAEWIRGKNPLLLDGLQGWNFGFRYTEGAYAGPHTQTLPDVRGILTFGRGRERGAGRFGLDLASIPFQVLGRTSKVYANLDANLVGGTGTDNLYYIATAGADIEIHPRILIGPRIYHRSNHTFGPGPDVPTNLNIIQIAARTPGWEYADRLPGQLMPVPGGRWTDRVEASLVPGVVTGSAFTDARSWDLQAGVRFDLTPRTLPIVPFARVSAQWGDVTRREVSLGISTPLNLVVEVLYRRDSQYFGSDDRDIFLAGSLYF